MDIKYQLFKTQLSLVIRKQEYEDKLAFIEDIKKEIPLFKDGKIEILDLPELREQPVMKITSKDDIFALSFFEDRIFFSKDVTEDKTEYPSFEEGFHSFVEEAKLVSPFLIKQKIELTMAILNSWIIADVTDSVDYIQKNIMSKSFSEIGNLKGASINLEFSDKVDDLDISKNLQLDSLTDGPGRDNKKKTLGIIFSIRTTESTKSLNADIASAFLKYAESEVKIDKLKEIIEANER